MKGYQQFFKLALACFFLAAMLHIPGIMLAQEKSNLKLEIFSFPVAPNPALSTSVDDIREYGAVPAVGIMTMAPHHTATHITIPYVLYNINDDAEVNVFIESSNGMMSLHESLILGKAQNNHLQATSIPNTTLQSDSFSVMIEACQKRFLHCSNVIIIVTVDGRPPKTSISSSGN